MRGVNLKVDITVELEDIIDLNSEREVRCRVCALKINGKAPAKAGLMDLKSWHPEDYKKILNVIRLVASRREVKSQHVKRGKGRYHDIYEMRGGQARLFFFFEPVARAIVVCTNLYWKAKPSRKEQDQAFERSLQFRDIYAAHAARAGEGKR